ncbi:MAG: phosphatase PAP2 family protein [Terriglobia bacterium]
MNPTRPVSLRLLISNVLKDQAKIWSFPKLLLEGKYWRPTILFVAVTCLLFVIDPLDPHYFRHTARFHEFNLIVSGHHATVAMWAVVVGALVIGMARSDAYLKQTFFYAFEAILDSEIFTQVLKGIDRRVRPQDVHNYQHLWDSWFQDKGHWYAGPGSFPSGHMIAAISIATVFAVRYSHHRWAPGVAYSLAGIIGVSRITLLSHFPSDVFAATVFGYVIARHVVLRKPPIVVPEEIVVPTDEEASRVGVVS